MTERPPSYRVLAVHYATRQTTLSDAYYRWSTYGEPDGPLQVSYYFWILEPLHSPGSPPIVLDCGFEPGLGERLGRECLCAPAEALARLGIDPVAVDLLVISHIHWDHVGNVHLFPNARMPVARAELEFWTADPVAQRPQFSAHADPNGIEQLRRAAAEDRVDLIEDRAEVAPGITAVRIGGHAPGQLVFEVAGDHGPLVLASDAIHYDEELERERPFGIFTDLADTYRGYGTLKRYASAGAAVVPGHDPSVMNRYAPLDGDAAGIAVCLTDTGSER
jgi:glyoxylase-like metal-dependent hydrolase (beta-lactamase superfamily II)